MDPLSIIAGVAGIATAGVSLVEVLFDTIDSYQNAPKDIVSIARGVQDLSIILDQLKQVLIDGRNMHTRWLLKSVASAIRQIEYVHAEVWELIPRGGSGFERVKWTFRKGKVRDLLNKIETQKSTVQLVCTTLLLAIQQKKVTKHSRRRPGNDSEKYARSRLRRQAENLVKTAHESLLNLTQSSDQEAIEGSSTDTSQSQRQQEPQTPLIDGSPTTPTIRVSGPEQDFPDDNEDLSSQKTPDETALWVYDMVFSPTAERKAHEGDAGPRPDGSNALILRNSQGTDIVLASKRPMAAEVVDDLLYDWTHLSWHDIKETSETVRVERPEQPRSQDGRRAVIEEPPRSIFDEV
ncbi:Helo-like-N domain-containing protein [Fusarium keratoplasticum]|nr:Helo-like-N domain-containing protein [Fusarium keratoplasticum]